MSARVPAIGEIFADRFATVLGIPPVVRRTMQANLERRLGVEWKHLHLPSIAARLEVPALIVQDADDSDVSVDDARAIQGAWRDAELMVTQGHGHRAVIRAPEIMRRTVEFLGAAGR